MTNNEFQFLLGRRICLIRSVLAKKSEEYSSAKDRLHNFKRAAELRDLPADEVLLGMLVKHWVSIEDLVHHGLPAPEGLVDEKIGDAINYLILLEAVLKEQNDETKNTV